MPSILLFLFYTNQTVFAAGFFALLVGGLFEWFKFCPGLNAALRTLVLITFAAFSAAIFSVIASGSTIALLAVYGLVIPLFIWMVKSQGHGLYNHPLVTSNVGQIYLLLNFYALQILFILQPSMWQWWLFCLLILIWSADTFAYFVGKQCGCHKLAASISPGKSIEGAIGGVLGVALVALVLHHFVIIPVIGANVNIVLWSLMCMLIAVLSIVGDLFESLFKRIHNIKDSGTIIPGHGGILDRFDSFFMTLPFYVLWVWMICKGSPF
jgi:phosphatidate cytidylyltransferase